MGVMADVDGVNRAAYRSARTVKSLSDQRRLWRPEQMVLDRVAAHVRGRPILDVGVGTGRTTPALLALSPDYTAIDYLPEMVNLFRSRYPEVRVLHQDARDLSPFGSDHFGLVMFSWAGIDSVGHLDRLIILRHIHRVLAPGGWFLFSSHNRRCRRHDGGLHLALPAPHRNPLVLASRSLVCARDALASLRNRRRLRHRTERHDSYAISTCPTHHFGQLVYLIDVHNAQRQLREAGFTDLIEVYDEAGRPVKDDSEHALIHYLARKAPVTG